MTEAEERAFEAKAEKHFQSQRELPNGRDFRWNSFRFNTREDMKNYRKNFNKVFPDAPGSFLDTED